MPFKRGVAPIRRTIKYLESGPLVFKDRVKIVTVNFSENKNIAWKNFYATSDPGVNRRNGLQACNYKLVNGSLS